MAYEGDIRLGSTIDIKFCTVGSDGAPTVLAGTPVVSAYPANSGTQLTAGVTLTVDFDSVVGLNNVRVVATTGNGYLTATNYTLVVTTGTVGGVSVVGYVVGSFSIENRSPLMSTAVGRTLDVSATGEAGVDWANVGSPTTALALTGTTIAVTQQVDVNTIKTQAVTAAAGVTFPTSIASPTNITAGVITTVTNLTNAPTSGDLTATMKASVTTAATAATPTIASVSGAVGSVTGNVGGSVVGNVNGNVAGNVTGSVGSVVGAVGSVTGAVGGNLGGSVLGSVVGAVGSVTGSVGGNVVGTVASVVGAVASVTGNVGGNVVGSVGSLATQAKADVNAELSALLTATIADSIPADGTRPSIANGIYMLVQFMFERSVSSTTLTVKKANGATALMTFTLDSATLPTSITRTT